MIQKKQPADIYNNFIKKNDQIILVEDPKHSKDCYHYTLWLIDKDIKNILNLKKNHIKEIESFISELKNEKIYDNEKTYFTYPPSHNGVHLHILPKEYISHRPKEELYSFEEIHKNFDNINKINDINNQKKQAEHLELKFNIGLIIIENVKKIINIKNIIQENSLNFVVVIRKQHPDTFTEELIKNYKFINVHICTEKLFLYANMINYDFKVWI